ncbi:hypothetical protein [Saccharicrinis fermentans]|nr:hypothetical protein [Saccharicrinis fermentans]
MKNLFSVVMCFVALGFVSCEKESVQEAPGNIPGMGNNQGQLEISESFDMPEDISIVGTITGAVEEEEITAASLKSYSNWDSFGSGQDVILKVTLQNNSVSRRTVFFPKGLVWKCVAGDFQHGIQIQTTWLNLGAGETRTITIRLYCANLHMDTPDYSGIYEILGVTSSKVLWRFLDLIQWRMVNYEMYVDNSLKAGSSDLPEYTDMAAKLQTMIHKLTDTGETLSDEDIAFIESIPELPVEQRPVLESDGTYSEDILEYGQSNQ